MLFEENDDDAFMAARKPVPRAAPVGTAALPVTAVAGLEDTIKRAVAAAQKDRAELELGLLRRPPVVYNLASAIVYYEYKATLVSLGSDDHAVATKQKTAYETLSKRHRTAAAYDRARRKDNRVVMCAHGYTLVKAGVRWIDAHQYPLDRFDRAALPCIP